MTTYYVDPLLGDDAFSGLNHSTAFQHIAYGITFIGAGDTLHLNAGVYDEAMMFFNAFVPALGSSGSHVTIEGEGSGTIIRPTSDGSSALQLNGDNQTEPFRYVDFVDMVFDGVDAPADTYGCVLSNGTHHITFIRVEIKNWTASGLATTQSTGKTVHDIIVFSCNIHHNGTSSIHAGISVNATQSFFMIAGSSHDNVGLGFQWIVNTAQYGDLGADTGAIVSDVMLYNNTGGGILFGGVQSNQVNNCLIYGNGAAQELGGIACAFSDHSAANHYFYNNTIYANTGYPVKFEANQVGGFVQNNILWGHGGSYTNTVNDLSGTVTQNHNVATDPLFVNIPTNFRVSAGSPAIGAAIETVTPAISDDIDGNPRIVPWTAGCYQYPSGRPTMA